MKIFLTVCFCILFIVPTLAQTFEPKGNFKMTVGDGIQHFQMLDDGKTLLLIGLQNAVFWDIENNKVSESSAFENNFSIRYGASSPDGRKVLSLDKDFYMREKSGSTSYVIDLHTGKRILKFDEKIGYGAWSKNGKVLVTANTCFRSPYGCSFKDITFTFRDGESLEKLSSITIDKISGFFLSPDGERVFTSEKIKKNGKSFHDLKVWNTRTGRIEQTLLGENDYARSGGIFSSENENFIGVVAEKKSDKKDKTVFVWKTTGNSLTKYQINAAEKIKGDDLIFSLDEKLIAFDTGDKVQYYEIASGEKFSESGKDRVPDLWIADNRLVIYRDSKILRAYPTGSENPVYYNDLVYETTEEEVSPGRTDDVPIDYTVTSPDANGNIFLFASNRNLRIYDSKNGKLLQTLVSPEKNPDDDCIDKVINKFDKVFFKKETGKNVLSKTVWSKDYRYILGRSYEYDSVYVWERID